MIRGILAILFVLIFLTVSLILIPIAYLIGLFDRHARDVYAQSLVAWGFRVIGVIVGAKVTEKGREKLPRGEAALYVANHRSIFDIVLLDARMPAPTAIVAKKELTSLSHEVKVEYVWTQVIVEIPVLEQFAPLFGRLGHRIGQRVMCLKIILESSCPWQIIPVYHFIIVLLHSAHNAPSDIQCPSMSHDSRQAVHLHSGCVVRQMYVQRNAILHDRI